MNRRKFFKKGIYSSIGFLISSNIALAKIEKEKLKKDLSYLDDFTKKIIYLESNWKYWEKRQDTKATGLMQITPIVLKEYNHFNQKKHNLDDLFNPYINVKIGEWYLYDRIKEHYLPHYKLKTHKENIVASYNWGPSNVGKTGDALQNFYKLPKETRYYLIKYWKLKNTKL